MTSSVVADQVSPRTGEHLYHIAVLLPCYNEAVAIRSVIEDFQKVLPHAKIYVYDNNSTDDTIVIARKSGAVVRSEKNQGKGNVLRRMFADIDADIYVLADGDGTYDATAAPRLISRLIEDQLDLVNGSRASQDQLAYRRGHRFGNVMLTGLVQLFFGRQFNDILSGYKVLTRRFAKSFPAVSRGFETETELAVHALELRMPCAEVETAYRERPPNSVSKLRTFRDGFRILTMIVLLVKGERPLQFFGLIGILLSLLGIGFGLPVIWEYLETGLVPRLPTALLSVGLMLTGVISFFSGLILDMLTQTRREIKRLIYLSIPGLGSR